MQDAPYGHDAPRRLTRGHDRKLGGVCGGLGEYFDVDPTLVRLGFVLLVVLTAGAGGLLAYLVLWIVMPEPEDAGGTAPSGTAPSEAARVSRAPRPSNGRMALAIAVLVVGLFAIGGLPFAGWMHDGFFRFSWPVALLVVAILLVAAKRRRP